MINGFPLVAFKIFSVVDFNQLDYDVILNYSIWSLLSFLDEYTVFIKFGMFLVTVSSNIICSLYIFLFLLRLLLGVYWYALNYSIGLWGSVLFLKFFSWELIISINLSSSLLILSSNSLNLLLSEVFILAVVLFNSRISIWVFFVISIVC